jgi:hypothetical protein
MDQYMDAEQKRHEGVPLSGKEKGIVALVRARDIFLSVATPVVALAATPVALISAALKRDGTRISGPTDPQKPSI